MKILTKFLKRSNRFFATIIRINWLAFIRLHNTNSSNVIWIPKFELKYLGSDYFLWDFATLSYFVQNKIKFRILFGTSIGEIHNSNIYYTLGEHYNIFKITNYRAIIDFFAHELTLQGNQLYPSENEARLWENKSYMHQKFKEYGINEPQTELYSSVQDLKSNCRSYPFLLKAEHSCSAKGVYKIENTQELEDILRDTNFIAENHVFIKQELLNIRRDLRVILVGDEIVFYYWRINKSAEWKPTSTSYGSEVDFIFFPEQWRSHIIQTFKKLNITTGAFDVTWQNDDLSTIPIYLEVSPVYQPNPKFDIKGKPYAYFKNRFSLFNSWDTRYVKLVFSIKSKQLKYLEIK